MIGKFWGFLTEEIMKSKNYKGRKTKRQLSKCKGVAITLDKVQYAYADILNSDEDITEFICNVSLEGIDFTTDFLCVKASGDYMVRECVFRKNLSYPRTAQLLDLSRNYWRKRGVDDWGIVVDKE